MENFDQILQAISTTGFPIMENLDQILQAISTTGFSIMENLDQILQAISTTGFPIIVCLILMWYVNKQLDTHKEETNALKDVIAENTAMVQKLTIMIENKYKGGD